MKTLFSMLFYLFIFSMCSSQDLKDGDVIFQTSRSSQSRVIQEITNSNLTHCGIIFFKDNKPYVFESVNSVKLTPLSSWIRRGVGGKYKIVRLDYKLRDNHKKIMLSYAKKQIGKQYDSKFQWSDTKMYCSELVWKDRKITRLNSSLVSESRMPSSA